MMMMSNFRCRKKKPEPQKKVPDGKKKNLDDGVLALRRKKSSRSKSQSKIEEGHFSESTTRSPIVFLGGGMQFKFIKSL